MKEDLETEIKTVTKDVRNIFVTKPLPSDSYFRNGLLKWIGRKTPIAILIGLGIAAWHDFSTRGIAAGALPPVLTALAGVAGKYMESRDRIEEYGGFKNYFICKVHQYF